jgi:hypothetical protein
MTQAVTTTVHTAASIDVRTLVLPRATWHTAPTADGRLSLQPQKGTWYGHILRGRANHDVMVVPLIACPSCNGTIVLSHTASTAKVISALHGGGLRVPIAHQIDHLGRVQPDIRCTHGSCNFHRRVYLDRWNKTKPLFAIAYVNQARGEHGEIEIAYSHAIDAREARFHLGAGNYRIIASGPAVGFFVDEKTGRMTAE